MRTNQSRGSPAPGNAPAPGRSGFTIIELLVVVSIIALLVGILLPAIGKARDQAQLTRSQAQIKQLGTAAVTYSAEWKDRQLTYCNDNLARYGANPQAAIDNFAKVTGYDHPAIMLGYAQGIIWSLVAGVPNVPLDWPSKFGSFRIPNGRQFNQYLNGRFYDPIFYAPKDTAVVGAVEQYWDWADEYVPTSITGPQKWSSYCFSPAAMFSPDVFSYNKTTGFYYTPEFSIQSGLRSPSMSQATYSDLKTHMMEHHWLQNRKKTCVPQITGGAYDGCQPFFFNGSVESAPVTLFYDGHVGIVGQRDAIDATFRAVSQSGQANGGTWSKDTPMGGCYEDFPACPGGGYYMDYGLDWTNTSYHILTTNGIKGRDIIAH